MAPMEILKSSNSGRRDETSSRAACRRKLQNTFDHEENVANRSVLSVLSLNDNTRKALRNGAERISKTFNTVRTSFGTLTQRFRISTRRRQILEEGPMTPNPNTPHSYSKQVLGRTPTTLYSPFGIDTPNARKCDNKENRPIMG